MSAYRFDRYELFPESRRLIHEGRDTAVGLRVFDVITYLVQNRQRAIGRDELIAAVWGRSEAGDAMLAQVVLKARRAFGDDGNAQNYIRTIPRFGYQWVAETQPFDAAESEPAHVAHERMAADDDVAGDVVVSDKAIDAAKVALTSAATANVSQRARWRWPIGAAAALALALAVGWATVHRHAPVSGDAAQAPPESNANLILVLPTHVQSTVAEDGWMRLGVMSLSAQALGDIAGHAVVPDETALAAVARAGAQGDMAHLRTETRASIVITSEANRSDTEWVLSATVFGPDGQTQMVGAKAADPIVAAGALARNLHDVLAPADAPVEGEALPPEVSALNARMKAAILEGQNGRALALYDTAAPSVAAAPTAILLRAEALIQLGRANEAAASLHTLVDRAAATPAPRWLGAAWSALGDCELSLGHPALAETHFRHALDLLAGSDDHRTTGLAWRGLGIAQVLRNDLDDAEQSHLHARLQLERVGDRQMLARVIDCLAYIAAHRGRMAEALLLYEQAATIGATIGSNETELGSQLNLAQSHEYLLHHSVALEKLRALLPRLNALDYPALHRFGLSAYASVLVETGAYNAAKQELARMDVESAAAHDGVVDVRLDEAQNRLAIGDIAGSIRQAEDVRASLSGQNAADQRLEALAVLLQAHIGGDAKAARTLAENTALWEPANALAPARVHALVALARWHAQQPDDTAASGLYRQAFALARDFGTPIILRDAAVPYAEFQLSHADANGALATASVLGPYADEDFQSALLLARLAAANRDSGLAQSYFVRARRLAGERWTPPLAEEESAALRGPGDTEPKPGTRTTAAVIQSQ